MQRTATLAPPHAFAHVASDWATRLRHLWEELWLGEDECYLRGARDVADLERRQRSLERGRAERFGPFEPEA